jgi:hypothetical protein
MKQAALAALEAEQDHDLLSYEVALKVRDASMLCTAFGHSSLAQRGQVLIDTKAMAYSSNRCSDPSCQAVAAGCKGNRFEVYTSSGAECVQIVLCHHKGGSRGVMGTVLQLTDPAELQLLHGWEERGRPVIADLAPDGEMYCNMYLSNAGEPFNQSSLCEWWRDLHR